MSNLTDSQKQVLTDLKSGAKNIPAIHAGRLGALGLVEKTGEASGQRGYANVTLTAAGKAAI